MQEITFRQKIEDIIRNRIEDSNWIVIYPYGKIGQLAHYVILENKIKNDIIFVDNKNKKFDYVITADELIERFKAEKDNIKILICTVDANVKKQIIEKISLLFAEENIVDIFEGDSEIYLDYSKQELEEILVALKSYSFKNRMDYQALIDREKWVRGYAQFTRYVEEAQLLPFEKKPMN